MTLSKNDFIKNIDSIESTVFSKMCDYYSGDPKRIQHFVKVHSFSKQLGLLEKISDYDLSILRITALMHDIGIKSAELKYGNCAGPYQEELGPAPARDLLAPLNLPDDVIERICYLIAHHHTYKDIDGMDYQILVESDFLVNLYEDAASTSAILRARETIFRTTSGINLLNTMFDI